MQSAASTKGRLCKRCCEILNRSNFSPLEEFVGVDTVHDFLPLDLQVSADGGCRGCQMIWLHTIFHLERYEKLTSKHTLHIDLCSRKNMLYLTIRLYYDGSNKASLGNIGISFFDQQPPAREMPTILGMTLRNRLLQV